MHAAASLRAYGPSDLIGIAPAADNRFASNSTERWRMLLLRMVADLSHMADLSSMGGVVPQRRSQGETALEQSRNMILDSHTGVCPRLWAAAVA